MPIVNASPVPETNAFFLQQWETYRRVFGFNYMRHRELAGMVHDYLVSAFSRPYSLLDLGCGDAAFTQLAAEGTPLASYVGVDLSPTALGFARERLKEVVADCGFIECDLASAPQQLLKRRPKFDAVLASFSVHHLSCEAKGKLIREIGTLLEPGGVFLMVDCVMRPEETRESYLDRYMDLIRRNWTKMEPTEVAAIEDHIRSSDYPEKCETLREIANKAGCSLDARYVADDYQDMFVAFHYD